MSNEHRVNQLELRQRGNSIKHWAEIRCRISDVSRTRKPFPNGVSRGDPRPRIGRGGGRVRNGGASNAIPSVGGLNVIRISNEANGSTRKSTRVSPVPGLPHDKQAITHFWGTCVEYMTRRFDQSFKRPYASLKPGQEKGKAV